LRSHRDRFEIPAELLKIQQKEHLMSLFDAPDPRKVELKGTVDQTAPQYLTDYLSALATAGQGQLNTSSIAPLNQNLQNAYGAASNTLSRYQTPMDLSLNTLEDAAEGVSAADISQFYNPYEQDVVSEMGRQSALNVQQGMMPALKAAFAGQGAFGSQRYANATGQALGDVQSDLYGNQAKLRSEGYKNAMDAALRDRGYDITAGQGLYGLGQAESSAATTGLKALGDLGTSELAYDQSKIEAPLTRAMNVAKILQGYQFPMDTAKTEEQIPGSFAPSPLQQIAGLGTLIGAGTGKDGLLTRAVDWVGQQFPGSTGGGFPSPNSAGSEAGTGFTSDRTPII
jgi:hypothetical protein